MDPQTMLIGAAAFVICAILIYLITAFAMKEKTFEEVLAEQRKRQEEERIKLGGKPDKKSDKDNKKKSRKPKDKSKEKHEKESTKEHKMVNLEIEPEVIEPVETSVLTNKKIKGKKNKPILVNKDEQPSVSESKQAKELFHKEIAPKDEIELHHQHREKTRNDGKLSKKTEKVDRIEKVQVQHVEKTVEAIEPKSTAHDSDTRGALGDAGKVAAGGSKLIASVKSASLTESDVQSLIEILLNRQGIRTPGSGAASSEWNKKSQKGSETSLLKKQLEEKEIALQEEQKVAMSANTRVKEVRQELSTEKVKFLSLEKRYQEKIGSQNQDLEALHSRMQNTHKMHVREMETIQAKVVQMEASGDKNLIQKLQEEKKIMSDTLAKTARDNAMNPSQDLGSMKQKVQIMEKELSSNAVKLNSTENARKSLETKLAKFEEKQKTQDSGKKDAEVLLNRKLEEVSQQLRKSEASNENLAKDKRKTVGDLSKATDGLTNAQKEVSTLKSKLQELEKHLSNMDSSRDMENKLQESRRKQKDLDGNLKNLEKQLSDAKTQGKELETQVQSLKQDNYILADEVKVTKERHVQASRAPNGDVQEKPHIDLGDHDKIVAEKSTKIQSLQEQLDSQKKKNNDNTSVVTETESLDKGVLQRLFPDISINDKLVHKEWMSHFEKDATVYFTKLASKSSDSTKDASDLQSFNAKLQTQVEEYKQLVANTELKLKQLEQSVESEEKRWKEEVKEAQSQLNSSSSRVSDLEQDISRHESQTKEALSTLAATEKRLQDVESSNKQFSQKTSNSSAVQAKCSKLESRLQDVESVNSEYERQIQNYTTVLSLTEDKLSQLEQKAVSEEGKWHEKIQQTEKDLQTSKQEVTSLQEQVKTIRGSTEMEVKVDSLEYQLRESEDRCSLLEADAQEAQTKVVNIQTHLETVRGSSEDLEALRKRIQELETTVNSEKKKSKELSTNTVKLNGIIKTGQDALRQEQETVGKLTEQLNSGQKSGTNAGPKGVKEATSPGNDVGTSV